MSKNCEVSKNHEKIDEISDGEEMKRSENLICIFIPIFINYISHISSLVFSLVYFSLQVLKLVPPPYQSIA